MAKKEFDPQIIDRNCAHGGNSVEYCVYHDKRKTINIPKNPTAKFKVKMRSSVCFSGLLYEIGPGVKTQPNRIYYHMKESKHLAKKLTDEERTDWIRLAKKYKLLPHYVKDDVWKDGVMVLKLEGLTPATLYIYLSSLRYIREEPGFVKALVYLVKKLNMNFYAAFVFATKNCMTAPGHHVISLYRNYYEGKKDIEDTEISLKLIRSFRLFLRDPEEYDKRKFDGSGSFRCASTIEGISSLFGMPDVKIPGKNLFDKNVIQAIKAPSKEKLTEHLDNYKKGKKQNDKT